MGTFLGHILPGTFFILFGVWWTYATSLRYFKYLLKKRTIKRNVEYYCTPTFQMYCCPNLCIEGLVKIVACIIGAIGENVTAFKDGKFVHMNDFQQIIMYTFYGLNGLVDILTFYNYPLPTDLDYMTMLLAGTVECLLFLFHFYGRDPIDVYIYILLIISLVGLILSVIVEWKHRNNVLSHHFRTMCVLLHGLWFCYAGFVIYSPFSNGQQETQKSGTLHTEIMFITGIFCWYIAGVILFISLVNIGFYFRYKSIINNAKFLDNFPEVKYHNFDDEEDSLFMHSRNTKDNRVINLKNNLNNYKPYSKQNILAPIEESADDEV